jgi:hypothetical protein
MGNLGVSARFMTCLRFSICGRHLLVMQFFGDLHRLVWLPGIVDRIFVDRIFLHRLGISLVCRMHGFCQGTIRKGSSHPSDFAIFI